MKATVTMNFEKRGVEICTETEHFVISASPSMVMNWNDAVRYFDGNEEWQLPTQKQLKIVADHIDEVNALIKANGGYELRGWFWTTDEYDEFCAWGVGMYSGSTDNLDKLGDDYVRAVSALKVK